jgi:peptidoglycan biosynthesis protein MviN/MurJ (putative lipid II flippase)
MKVFKKFAKALIRMMMPLVIFALMVGTAGIFLDLKRVFLRPSIAGGFNAYCCKICHSRDTRKVSFSSENKEHRNSALGE